MEDEKKQTMEVDEGCYGRKIVKVEYPSNSHKTKVKKEKPEKLDKVVKGTVVTRKKSFGKRFMETFLGEGVGSVMSYIVHDVLIPAAKDTLEDLVKGSIEVLLRGESRGYRSSRRGNGGRSYVSYSNCYKSDRDDKYERQSVSLRARHNFDDIILETRGEAEEVLSQLVDLIEDYGMASVADLYELVGITGNFTDNKYGWTKLNDASVSRVRDGYLIDLPRATPLD
jgi:hypothetical protein